MLLQNDVTLDDTTNVTTNATLDVTINVTTNVATDVTMNGTTTILQRLLQNLMFLHGKSIITRSITIDVTTTQGGTSENKDLMTSQQTQEKAKMKTMKMKK